jgi:hypothetical protein
MDANIRLTHNAEQARAVLAELSLLLGAYFEQLQGEGFTRAEAFTAILHVQQLLMTQRSV